MDGAKQIAGTDKTAPAWTTDCALLITLWKTARRGGSGRGERRKENRRKNNGEDAPPPRYKYTTEAVNGQYLKATMRHDRQEIPGMQPRDGADRREAERYSREKGRIQTGKGRIWTGNTQKSRDIERV